MSFQRVHLVGDPFVPARPPGSSFDDKNQWPASWILVSEAGPLRPCVAAYKLPFKILKKDKIRVHVSADERYELFLDGERLGRGPERGDLNHWFFESYDLDLDPGDHVLVSRVWSVGENAPFAQITLAHGFILAAEGEHVKAFSTGEAPWQGKLLSGYSFRDKGMTWATGDKVEIDGLLFDWDFEKGMGQGWAAVQKGARGLRSGYHQDSFPALRLKPATLPPMVDLVYGKGRVRHIEDLESSDTDKQKVEAKKHKSGDAAAWKSFLEGQQLRIKSHTQRRVILDLEDYLCAYTELKVSGGKGSSVRILWAESLYEEDVSWHSKKGNRDEVAGKYFHGIGDLFRPDGGPNRKFETLWWEAGRYLEILVETADEDLVLENLALKETGYPLTLESRFTASDPRYEKLIPLMFRTLRMDAHETYMDCPYFEQLQYVGDTRLEVLTTYVSTLDDRLARKAISLYDWSRLPDGLTQSRYPSRNFQVIPPFSLWWIGMVHDFALWRQDPAFVRDLLPGVRAVLDGFGRFQGKNGLVEAPPGWNFVDWVKTWTWGIPPGGDTGISGPLNFQYILSLNLAADLEQTFGDVEVASLHRRRATEVLAAMETTFYVPEKKLYADDVEKRLFSEHGQILPLLGATLPEVRKADLFHSLTSEKDLARATYYFTHYFLEACRQAGSFDLLHQRLEDWFRLPSMGFKTCPENPEPTRSDCHAWGAHPLYHYFASVLGIRPAEFGFRSVEVRPGLGPLSSAAGTLVHPRGPIRVEFERKKDLITGLVVLPSSLSGVYQDGQKVLNLKAGENRIV